MNDFVFFIAVYYGLLMEIGAYPQAEICGEFYILRGHNLQFTVLAVSIPPLSRYNALSSQEVTPMDTETNEPQRGRGIYLLPNLFTLSALFAGFYAIVAAMRGDFDNAAVALFIAGVMDALDGRVARLTHTQTAFGAELDSLSDMVCFGVAPALMAYAWGLKELGKAGWLVAFIYTACVALRLARFNVEHEVADQRYFKGLPCPPGAALLVSLIWCFTQYSTSSPITRLIVTIVAVLTSALMVSNLPYHSFKDFDLKNKVPFIAILIIVFFFVLISTDPPLILLSFFSIFVLSGPLLWLWGWYQRRKNGTKGTDNPKNEDNE